jgi:formyl-CoA transferase
MPGALPLSGITVVSVEQAVAAPFCTARLADAGARVIKIERPEGDFARGYDDVADGQSIHFVWLNRGKQSVVLDLSRADDRARLEQLIAGADVLVQNLKPGALGRLGFAVDRLRRDYPPLICCSIFGYGDDGPLAERKAYDLLVQAESGLASITGGPEGPARVGISIVDISTGVTAQAAILEALIARGRSGQGCDIRISMFDVMADWLTIPLQHAEAGHPPQRVGLAHPSLSPYGAFAAKDGAQIVISIQNDREWRAFCQHVLQNPAAADDPRFCSTVARAHHRPETDGMVAAVFAGLSREELIARLTAADTAFAEVNDMAALSVHPHLRRTAVDTPTARISFPVPAALFDGVSRQCGPVPALGADTERVLKSLTRLPSSEG